MMANDVARRIIQFKRDSLCNGPCSDAARLGVTDGAKDAAAGLETQLRQLRGLARASLAANDQALRRANGVYDLLAKMIDRKFDAHRGRRNSRPSRLGLGSGLGNPRLNPFKSSPRHRIVLPPLESADSTQQGSPIGEHATIYISPKPASPNSNRF